MERALEGFLRLPWGRILIVLAALAGLYLLGQFAGNRIISSLELNQQLEGRALLVRALLMASAIYIVLTAIPFMPGVEVGLSMLMLLGARVALLVYLSTICALTLSYLAGRFIPVRSCARAFRFFGLSRAEDLLREVAALPVRERLAFLLDHVPPGMAPFLLRHRYLALAIIINIPGNMVIGGGGGIALVAGMSRLFSWPAFLVTVAIAVAPVPLLIYFLQYWW